MATIVNYTSKNFIKLTPGRQITLKVLQEKSDFHRVVRLVPNVLKRSARLTCFHITPIERSVAYKKCWT